jgi:hypothetical protein
MAQRSIGRQSLIRVAGGRLTGCQLNRLFKPLARGRIGNRQPANAIADCDCRRVLHMQHFAWHDFGVRNCRRDDDPQATLDCPVELLPLLRDHNVGGSRRGKGGKLPADRQQARQARGRVLQIEFRHRLISQPGNLGTALDASPGRVDTVHDAVLRRLTGQQSERARARAAAPASSSAAAPTGEVAKALALVHGPAATGKCPERLA